VTVIAAIELDDALRPVAARASRIAAIVASVPELTHRSISTAGMRARTSSRARLRGARRAVRPTRPPLANRRQHGGVRVAEDQRAPQQT